LAAFISFLSTYAVWFYLAGLIAILFAVKVFLDARHQARTTIFSLEQEQSAERSIRALIVVVIIGLVMGALTAVNVFVAPTVPTPVPAVAQQTPPTIEVPIIRPTATPLPTATRVPPSPTETEVLPTPEEVTPTEVPTTVVTIPRPTRTIVVSLPAVTLTRPKNNTVETGPGKAKLALTFIWTWCDTCYQPGDMFEVHVKYLERATGQPVELSLTTPAPGLQLEKFGDIYQKAVDDKYEWYVIVLRDGRRVTPPSDIWFFLWH
jgi:hypothetical protein